MICIILTMGILLTTFRLTEQALCLFPWSAGRSQDACVSRCLAEAAVPLELEKRMNKFFLDLPICSFGSLPSILCSYYLQAQYCVIKRLFPRTRCHRS